MGRHRTECASGRRSARNTFVAVFGIVALLVEPTAPGAAESSAAAPRTYGADAPFTIDQLPPGRLRSDLERLTPTIRAKAMDALHRFSFPSEDVATLRVDTQGHPFYEDDFRGAIERVGEPRTAGRAPFGMTTQAVPSIAASSVGPATVFTLHSRPGAARTVYLNFRGHVITGTGWNTAQKPSLQALPYSLDTDYASFTEAESASIAEIWQRVAEDYAPYDIDVTTEPPPAFGPQTGHVLVTRQYDRNGILIFCSGCGGVAYVGVWGRPDYAYFQPALVFHEVLYNEHNVAEAASHELGHNLGLSHDGQRNPDNSTSEYYYGHGTGYTSWAPIMGAGYAAQVTQWSKGEYTGANNFQDDLSIMRSQLSDAAADHASTRSAATPIVASAGTVASTTPSSELHDSDDFFRDRNNRGTIGAAGDVDVFLVEAGSAGVVDLSVTPAWRAPFVVASNRGANLDVRARLLDVDGALLVESEPAAETNARVRASLPAGRYYLEVSGAGQGTPLTGYSSYASIGGYTITGSVPVGPTQAVSFESAAISASEGAGSVRIPVVRSGGTAGTVSVPYRTWARTAAAGSDYVQSLGTLVFPPGIVEKSITVQLVDNATLEPPETFAVDLGTAQGALQGAASSTTVTINDDESNATLAGFSLKSTTVAGCKAVTAVVTLSEPAPASGLAVSIADTLSSVTSPATVTVPGGSTTKSLTLKTVPVAAIQNGYVRATLAGTTLSQPLSVRPMGVGSVSLTPSTVVGGTTSVGKVNLECKAGPGPITIPLSTSNASIAYPAVAGVTIPIGIQAATFEVRTNAVRARSSATISALPSTGFGKSRVVTVTPAAAISPASLAFGSRTVGSTSTALGVTLANRGTAAYSVSSVGVTGTGASHFTYASACPSSLPAGGSCTISVRFAPTSTGSKTARLTVATSATDTALSVALSGTGTL